MVEGRRTLEAILDRRDPRLFVVVGPYSIHDPAAGLDYARRLRALADEVSRTLYLAARASTSRSRATSTGWKGSINDPRMDDSFRIDEGMERARRFLLEVNASGCPPVPRRRPSSAAVLRRPHRLDGDRRALESQTHREMSSGLSTPVGFKNGTDGDLDPAVNGIVSAASPHLPRHQRPGRSASRTRGNRYGHIVLRGGGGRPVYDTVSIAPAEEALAKAKLPRNVVVDCSHANSRKKADLQPPVLRDVVHQIREETAVVGLMLESFLEPGNQPIPADLSQLRYGCSVTDACIGWDTTAMVLRWAGRPAARRAAPARRPVTAHCTS